MKVVPWSQETGGDPPWGASGATSERPARKISSVVAPRPLLPSEDGDSRRPAKDAMLPTLLLHSLAHAAPWPVDITAKLPQPPAEMAVYSVLPTDPVPRLSAVEDVFGLTGPSAWNDYMGGLVRVADDHRFGWAFADGGITFHDDSSSDAEVPMRVRGTDDVWADADALLTELDLFDASLFELTALRIARSEATVTGPTGRTFGPWTTTQTAVYAYTLDGVDVFGPGGETTVEFDDRGVVALSDAQRALDLAEVVTPDAPGVAIHRWMDRAQDEHRWSVYRSYIHDVERVRIDDVRLGYFAPAIGAGDPTIEPVYQIHGELLGHDAQGHRVSVELLWWEPVREDRSIPSLHIFAPLAK